MHTHTHTHKQTLMSCTCVFASVHVSVYRFWHDRCYVTIVIQHLSDHYPIANGIYIGHFGDNTKSEWAPNRREEEKKKASSAHLWPCIHVRAIHASVYLLFAWRCYAFLFIRLFLLAPFIRTGFSCAWNTKRFHTVWLTFFHKCVEHSQQQLIILRLRSETAIGNRLWNVNACVETFIENTIHSSCVACVSVVRSLFYSLWWRISLCVCVCEHISKRIVIVRSFYLL